MTARLNYWFDTTTARLKMQSEVHHKKVDVVIIGGGIAGLSTLYQLLKKGVNAIAIEKTDIGFRASGRANGNANLPSLAAKYPCSFDTIYGMVKQNNNILRKIIQSEGMDCHMDMCGELQVCVANGGNMSESSVHPAIMHMDEASLRSIVPSKSFRSGMFFPASLMVNGYRLLYCLATICEATGRRIFSNVEVKKISTLKKSVRLTLDDSSTIECDKVVICNAVQADKLVGRGFLKPMTINSGCSKLLPFGKYWTFPPAPIYILDDSIRLRIYNQRLFIDVLDGRQVDDILPKICSYFDHLSGFTFEYAWSDQVLNTPDGLPVVGEVKPNVYLNTAFGSHGFSFALFGGKIISNHINNEADRVDLFDPCRFKKE